MTTNASGIVMKDGKVFNPKTKRWVLIRGKTGKTLIASLQAKSNTASDVPMVQPMSSREVSRRTTKKVQNEIQSTSTSKNYFSSKEHEKFCDTGNWNNITVPFIHTTHQVTFPMLRIVYKTSAGLNGKPKLESIIDGHPFVNQYEYSTNNLLNNVLKDVGITNQPDNIDMEWVHDQMRYVKQLPKEDLFTLVGYTNQSFSWGNAFLRGTWSVFHYTQQLKSIDFIRKPFFFPIYFQLKRIFLDRKRNPEEFSSSKESQELIVKLRENPPAKETDIYIPLVKQAHTIKESIVREALQMFCDDLSRIIQTAPRVKKPMTIFRGVKQDIFRETEGKYYKNIGYVSCSFDLRWSKKYMASPNCCLQVVRLLKGAAAIIASPVNSYGGEKEVVLDHGTTYFFKKRNAKKLMMMDSKQKCANPSTDVITVSEVVVT